MRPHTTHGARLKPSGASISTPSSRFESWAVYKYESQGALKYYSGLYSESVRNFPESLSGENRNHCPKLSGIGVRKSPDIAHLM